jgi:hypothetical protein
VAVRNGHFIGTKVSHDGVMYRLGGGVPMPDDINAIDQWRGYQGGDKKVTYTIEVFETADPPEHKWHPGPGSGGYKVLWQKSFTLAYSEQDIKKIQTGAADGFGPEVKGLRARLTLPKKQFAEGESIIPDYVVMNVSNQKLTIWHCGFWPNHLVLVKDATGKEPPLTLFGQQCRAAFSPGGDRFKNVAVTLPPGGEDTKESKQDLTQVYDLSKPGKYTVQYIYEEKQGGWEGRLPSNIVEFEITPAPKPAQDVGMIPWPNLQPW